MDNTLNIVVVGATGKMGQTLIEEIYKDLQTNLVGAIEHKNSPHIGENSGYFCGIDNGISISSTFLV